MDGSTHNIDIDPTTIRPVEVETLKKAANLDISKSGHCILARTQQNIKKMRLEGRNNEYSNGNDVSRGVKTSR